MAIKFIAPNSDDIEVKCIAKIAISTDAELCDCIPDKGGYIVHPVPAPDSIKVDDTIHTNAGGNSQNDILFSLAKDISEAPINRGRK